MAKGVGDLFQSTIYPQESPTFEVHALDPSKPRRVTVTHEARKLAGSTLVKGGEAGPITLKLRPWGTIFGRVVDDEGQPAQGHGPVEPPAASQPEGPDDAGHPPQRRLRQRHPARQRTASSESKASSPASSMGHRPSMATGP